MKPSDRDLVDVILGDAPDTLQGKVREAASANPEISARYASWSGLIRSSRESQAAATLHRDIVENTRARLKESHLIGTESRKSRAHSAPGPAHRYALGAMAAAGLLLVIVSIYVLIGGRAPWSGDEPSSEPAQAVNNVDALEAITRHVDFAAGDAGDGTPASPFSSLRQAVTRSPSDGILKITAGSTSETLRFEKRLRIEAVDGKVQIGAS